MRPAVRLFVFGPSSIDEGANGNSPFCSSTFLQFPCRVTRAPAHDFRRQLRGMKTRWKANFEGIVRRQERDRSERRRWNNCLLGRPADAKNWGRSGGRSKPGDWEKPSFDVFHWVDTAIGGLGTNQRRDWTQEWFRIVCLGMGMEKMD